MPRESVIQNAVATGPLPNHALRRLGPPADFKPAPIQFSGWLRAADRWTFHLFPDGAVALCGVRRKSNHTALTCRGYKLCVLCREAMLCSGQPDPLLSQAHAAILAALRAKRSWEDLLTASNAWEMVTAFRELRRLKMVKRGPTWLTPRGRRRLETHEAPRVAGHSSANQPK